MNVKTIISSSQRRALVAKMIKGGLVESQSQLVKLLSREGIRVTQATASRDLEDLGAIRVRDDAGLLHYQFPAEINTKSGGTPDLILSVTASGNLAVVCWVPSRFGAC